MEEQNLMTGRKNLQNWNTNWTWEKKEKDDAKVLGLCD